VPVGRLLGDVAVARPKPAGSCIVVVATDAPLGSAQLARVARRAGLGLARTGSTGHHGSGEIFLALSTASSERPVDVDPLFDATVDATEEAVANAVWSAETTTGRQGRVAHALPHDAVLELLEAHRRLGVR
jgi:D-aminopeptidase